MTDEFGAIYSRMEAITDIMNEKIKNFLQRRSTFFACIAVVIVLAYAYCVAQELVKLPLRDVKEIHVKALCCTAYKVTCPISYAGYSPRMTGPDVDGIPLWGQIPGTVTSHFLYDLKHRDVMLEVLWITPVFKGKVRYYYEIDSPEVKENLLNFIEGHEADLQNLELQYALQGMMREYKKELTRIGDGDPYMGLERAGVAEWIKAGKDPEAEWKKKFPAEAEKSDDRR